MHEPEVHQKRYNQNADNYSDYYPDYQIFCFLFHVFQPLVCEFNKLYVLETPYYPHVKQGETPWCKLFHGNLIGCFILNKNRNREV